MVERRLLVNLNCTSYQQRKLLSFVLVSYISSKAALKPSVYGSLKSDYCM